MAREKMLLDRIASFGGQGPGRYEVSGAENLDALMESVRRNIARLLNARHGMSEAMPDYGLPALTDLTVGSKTYVEEVQEAIRVAVEKYEPRLRRVRVTKVSDEADAHRLGFRIDASLVSQSGEHRVWYETLVTGSGEFEVSD